MGRFKAYLEAIARANGLGDGVEWLFYPGMLLESREKWWDDFRLRHAAHEGIDICFFRNISGHITSLGKKALVPALDHGIILNIVDDFLGQTLVISQGGNDRVPGNRLLVYSHLEIDQTLAPGHWVEKGQILAHLFDTRQKGSKLLPHLHLSWGELIRMPPWDCLDWHLFSNREKITLMNPVFI